MTVLGLETRTRGISRNGEPASEATRRRIEWKPEKSAVVICDMWDDHHCLSAAKRTAEMAPRVNEAVSGLRGQGTLIVHSPCGCMEFYRGSPQRRLAEQAPFASVPCEFGWNGWDTWREREIRELYGRTPLPDGLIDIGPCSCHGSEPCCEEGYYPWTRQIDTIQMMDDDAVTASGQELYNLLEQRGIDDVIVMGVHTNVCVLSQPYGIRQLVYMGKRPLLCRDLTDSFHRCDEDHFEGTDVIIEYIEAFWCPTITSDQLIGGEMFRFRDDKRKIV